MAQRHEPHDSLDFFPTPPWATRALCEHVIGLFGHVAWDPACGRGDMARPLQEYALAVAGSDVHDYGAGFVIHDFLMPFIPEGIGGTDWIITNPPFRLGEQFARRALQLMEEEAVEKGAAILVRTSFLETVERYRLFTDHPPAVVAQFAERVPMVKGRLDRTASTATSYTWIVWARGHTDTRLRWIPPCRKALDRDSDWPAEADAPASLEDTAA
ncbi:methyltransferase (plasmid) [Azospirillum brasilense]|uniref:Methyltransferase n=2 Tax=Azospirillum brasilense TaxID=192 RepID=A0A235HAP8_AZOBR|nr:methyltransferase [Azospirillum brasilense]